MKHQTKNLKNQSCIAMKTYIFLLITCFSLQYALAQDLNYSRAKIWFDGKSEMALGKIGIDLTEGDYRKGVWFISDFSEKEISTITASGFRIEILITNVKTFYRNRNNLTDRRLQETINES